MDGGRCLNNSCPSNLARCTLQFSKMSSRAIPCSFLRSPLLSPCFFSSICCSCLLLLGFRTGHLHVTFNTLSKYKNVWDGHLVSLLPLLNFKLRFPFLVFFLSFRFLCRSIHKTALLRLTRFLFLLLNALDSWIQPTKRLDMTEERVRFTQGSCQRDCVVWRYLPFFSERAPIYFSSQCIVCHRGYRIIRNGGVARYSFILVASFIDLLIIPLKTSPAVKVVPKIIKPLDFFLS